MAFYHTRSPVGPVLLNHTYYRAQRVQESENQTCSPPRTNLYADHVHSLHFSLIFATMTEPPMDCILLRTEWCRSGDEKWGDNCQGVHFDRFLQRYCRSLIAHTVQQYEIEKTSHLLKGAMPGKVQRKFWYEIL